VKASGFMDVLMGIVFVGLVTSLVSHPNTARVITSAGNAFSNSLAVAVKG